MDLDIIFFPWNLMSSAFVETEVDSRNYAFLMVDFNFVLIRFGFWKGFIKLFIVTDSGSQGRNSSGFIARLSLADTKKSQICC